MRPRLKPAAGRIWRAQTTLQFWRDPDRALVLTGVDPRRRSVLEALDGSRTGEEWHAFACAQGMSERAADRLLEALQAAHLLEDAGVYPRELTALPVTERDRLGPELAALSVTRTAPLQALARRRGAFVRLIGAGRLGAAIAGVLASAGIGALAVDDDRPVGNEDIAAFGYAADQLGRARAGALQAQLAASYPALRWPAGGSPALTVLADPQPPDPAPILRRDALAHLAVRVEEGGVVVGPLVIPGQSPCGSCLELARLARDPGWPLVAATPAADFAAAVPVALAAALAAREVLAYTDGGEPASFGATIEIAAAGWRVRRRSWAPHPLCGCGAGE